MVGWNVFQYLQTSLMVHERLFLVCGSHNGSHSEEVSLSTDTQSTGSLSGAHISSHTLTPILVYSKSSQNLIMETNGSDEVTGAILPQKSSPFPFIYAWKNGIVTQMSCHWRTTKMWMHSLCMLPCTLILILKQMMNLLQKFARPPLMTILGTAWCWLNLPRLMRTGRLPPALQPLRPTVSAGLLPVSWRTYGWTWGH